MASIPKGGERKLLTASKVFRRHCKLLLLVAQAHKEWKAGQETNVRFLRSYVQYA